MTPEEWSKLGDAFKREQDDVVAKVQEPGLRDTALAHYSALGLLLGHLENVCRRMSLEKFP